MGELSHPVRARFFSGSLLAQRGSTWVAIRLYVVFAARAGTRVMTGRREGLVVVTWVEATTTLTDMEKTDTKKARAVLDAWSRRMIADGWLRLACWRPRPAHDGAVSRR